MINFVTNQSLDAISGGWSGISANIFDQMQRRFPVTYVGPIEPPIPSVPKVLSKAARFVGKRGKLPVFGRARLGTIEEAWQAGRDPHAAFDLFHAATPWAMCRPPVPYGAYIDATFRVYMDIYSTPKNFSKRDMKAISARERDWMKGASALFFGSGWIRDIAVEEHGLDRSKTHVIWVGGNIEIPEKDIFVGGHTFLFVSLNFEKKGGHIAADALREVQKKIPGAELLVIGQRPPEEIMARPGIRYGGLLRKDVPDELARFKRHLATARGLVHPTSMDTMGAVLIEAGYFGCPSMATRRFGIPELVRDGETGYLFSVPITVDEVAQRMLALSVDDASYRTIRKQVRDDMVGRLSWNAFGDRMAAAIEEIAPAAYNFDRAINQGAAS